MKVAIIGLGDIAKKAHLPVLSSRKDLEMHLCTRNATTLEELGQKYKLSHLHTTLDSLVKSQPDCAFVSSTTNAHYEMVKFLLEHKISVYVDKPITMYYYLSKELVELAEKHQVLLMVGFNRRYAPAYQALKETPNPSMVIVQKNRKGLPDELRRFVVEDFVHVVDTMRYLFPYPIDQLLVNGMKSGNLLHHLTVQFIGPDGQTALGIMNRDGGALEEKVDLFSQENKKTVVNVSELFVQNNRDILHYGESDWLSTLYKRGFDHMVDDFLGAVREHRDPKITARDALITHEICERIVEKLQEKNG